MSDLSAHLLKNALDDANRKLAEQLEHIQFLGAKLNATKQREEVLEARLREVSETLRLEQAHSAATEERLREVEKERDEEREKRIKWERHSVERGNQWEAAESRAESLSREIAEAKAANNTTILNALEQTVRWKEKYEAAESSNEALRKAIEKALAVIDGEAEMTPRMRMLREVLSSPPPSSGKPCEECCGTKKKMRLPYPESGWEPCPNCAPESGRAE